MPADRREALLGDLRALEAWGSAQGWKGADPYDGLNATRVATGLRRTATGRRVLTQLVKRSPLDLRPLLGIPAERSSAALAQVVSAYALHGQERLLETALQLAELRCPGYEEPCFGYHFDVQTRVFFYPRDAPNTIATAFAGLAFLDAYERTGERWLLDTAVGTGDFFLRHVPQTEAGTGAFFGYLVGDRTPIHNANMLVCALLARLAGHTARPDLRAAAETGVAHTLAHQRPDGSWPYGELPHLDWIDNFHSGYVLECLLSCLDVDGAEAALERGLAYYRSALFLEDGTPKYTPNSTYPIDSQCVAQAIQTFARAGLLDDAWRVFDFAQRRMRGRDGLFAFQRRRLWANRTPHVRWTIAPTMLALTHLLHASEPSR